MSKGKDNETKIKYRNVFYRKEKKTTPRGVEEKYSSENEPPATLKAKIHKERTNYTPPKKKKKLMR